MGKAAKCLKEFTLLGELLRARDLEAHLHSFVERIYANSFYGFAPSQTIELGLLLVLSSWATKEDEPFRDAVEAELEVRGVDAKLCLK